MQRQYSSLRSFHEGKRNCYIIKDVSAGAKYLIRAGFMYGDYDGQDMLPMFDLYIGNDLWDTVRITNSNNTLSKEIIHIPPKDHVLVCLASTDHGIPFISTLELRPLDDEIYQTRTMEALAVVGRWDVGSSNWYRYPKDLHDLFWYPWQVEDCESLSTTLAIVPNIYNIPSVVMSTASVPIQNGSWSFWWPGSDRNITPGGQYYFYMHFAEIQLVRANQTREFNIFCNGDLFNGPISPPYLQTTTVYNKIPYAGHYQYNFTFFKTENSTLPSILNALEIYNLKQFSLRETDQLDVDAIGKVKSTYGLKRSWQGDPCLPEQYSWEGLNCSYHGNDKPPRIISLNLSSSELTGEIAPSIANLTMIQILELSNNNITGPVPEFLSQLQNLRVLNLENNQLTGSLPVELMAKWKEGLLQLRVNGNPNICASFSCKRKHSVVPVVVASVVGTSILLFAVAALIWWVLLRNRRHGLAKAKSNIREYSLESRKRQFIYDYNDVVRISNNFERVVGKGGFGTVYHGYMGDAQVAVKMLSRSAVQGYQQFQAEVNVLMRVHHKNLTALVGYFTNEDNTGLIYEYMANGDLQSHLFPDDSSINILKWEDRLGIAIDAAQGLEYLHHGCKPPIIHRDVKSANILLDKKYHAKLSDFGISKIFATDDEMTHISTVVAGTPGYLDPEYYKSNRLNEKSDIYSFGMVLLEIITGRPAISKTNDNTCISEWVTLMLQKGLINNIIDPRLKGNFHVISAWKAVEIAINCVSLSLAERPSMTQVVGELKECLKATKAAYEANESKSGDIHEIPLNLLTYDIDTQPLAR